MFYRISFINVHQANYKAVILSWVNEKRKKKPHYSPQHFLSLFSQHHLLYWNLCRKYADAWHLMYGTVAPKQFCARFSNRRLPHYQAGQPFSNSDDNHCNITAVCICIEVSKTMPSNVNLFFASVQLTTTLLPLWTNIFEWKLQNNIYFWASTIHSTKYA